MSAAVCLACGTMIDLGLRPRLFEEVVCNNCKQRFFVIEIDPPEICLPIPDYYEEEESQLPLEDQ